MVFTVGVIGAGLMGTAIAQTVAQNANVLLSGRRVDLCSKINYLRKNTDYFPNVLLHDNITAINDMDYLSDEDIIFLCIPYSVMGETIELLNNIVSENCIFVNTAKGIEKEYLGGNPSNFKITRSFDLILAETFLKFKKFNN